MQPEKPHDVFWLNVELKWYMLCGGFCKGGTGNWNFTPCRKRSRETRGYARSCLTAGRGSQKGGSISRYGLFVIIKSNRGSNLFMKCLNLGSVGSKNVGIGFMSLLATDRAKGAGGRCRIGTPSRPLHQWRESIFRRRDGMEVRILWADKEWKFSAYSLVRM